MPIKSQLIKCYSPQDLNYHCQTLGNVHGKCKSVNETKTQFVKLNHKSGIKKGLGHSQMLTNNFSRRNSDATISSTVPSPTNSTLDSTSTTKKSTSESSTHKLKLSSLQPQKSWSLPHIENDNDTKKSNMYEFTEQRCNYERMTAQRQQQPWPSEQLVRCNISNSRIPTCSIVQHQHNDDDDVNDNDKTALKLADDAINAKFLALREFRLNNSKDCFGDRSHQELYLMRAQKPENLTLTPNKLTPDCSDVQSYESNCWLGTNSKEFKDRSNLSKSSMPYATRQRLLREQLAEELPNKMNRSLEFKNMGLNRSLALSYQFIKCIKPWDSYKAKVVKNYINMCSTRKYVCSRNLSKLHKLAQRRSRTQNCV